eukprot:6201633-Pleurochrysis_carterae.AAC.1
MAAAISRLLIGQMAVQPWNNLERYWEQLDRQPRLCLPHTAHLLADSVADLMLPRFHWNAYVRLDSDPFGYIQI